MLDIISKFVSDLTNKPEETFDFSPDRLHLAEAALMFHVIQADGIIKPEERKRLAEVLKENFEFEEDEINSLVQQAEIADTEAIDLYKFTSVLKNNLDESQRITIVENLWEMVFADGILHELEDHVVWRIADLLGVDSRARVLMKQRVRDRTKQGAG